MVVIQSSLRRSGMSQARNHIEPAGAGKVRLWGRYSVLGLVIAVMALAADQLHKYWMIEVYRISEKEPVAVTSFLNLVMVWNPGISYGLFPAGSSSGRLLLVGISIAAVLALLIWMSNAGSRLVAAGIGLIVGGAVGNLIDRLVYGAVADFFSFHYAGYYWYVFNIADVAITAGVIGLILDWLLAPREAEGAPS
jgi:signal peptidase II